MKTTEPTHCPHCDYDEAEGDLMRQCAACRAADRRKKAASLLGQMARGVPKRYSAEEIAKRTKRLSAATKKRWPAKRRKRKGKAK